MSTFSERLRDRARELGWSQRALARAAGISSAHVSRMLEGSRAAAPSYAVVVRLADALGVPDRWLFWGDDFGLDDAGYEHNKNIALSIARAGAINERVLSIASTEKSPGPPQPSVLWWISRILALNTLHGFTNPPMTGARSEVRLDKSHIGKEAHVMESKAFTIFRSKVSPRGAKTKLARELGVPESTISNILARGSCGLEVATKIEVALGIPAAWWREPVAVEEVAR